MAFTMKTKTCKTCGEPHLVPGGKLSGLACDDCLKCREAKAKAAKQ